LSPKKRRPRHPRDGCAPDCGHREGILPAGACRTVLACGQKTGRPVSPIKNDHTKNTIVYNLILGSSNIEGFKLFKKTAWQTFGGKSSDKNTHGMESQLMFDLNGKGTVTTHTDEYCYYVMDIAKYLYFQFKGQKDIPLKR
jgi:hypothetical protein